ncbi:hypothetical protein ABPG77_000376 [Micractinium sp. CCAP 211/92]
MAHQHQALANAPCQYGWNAEKLGDSCFVNCCLFLLCGNWLCCCFTGNRKKLRANHRLADEPCSDCCVMCWCPACAICQEARVLKTNGPAPQFVQSAPQMYYGAPPPQQAMY